MQLTQGRNENKSIAGTPYAMRTRSIRIHGVVTSIGLENFCWDILSRIAEQGSLTVNRQLCHLHDDYQCGQSEAANFCSYLRIFCMRYLAGNPLLFQELPPGAKPDAPAIKER